MESKGNVNVYGLEFFFGRDILCRAKNLFVKSISVDLKSEIYERGFDFFKYDWMTLKRKNGIVIPVEIRVEGDIVFQFELETCLKWSLL